MKLWNRFQENYGKTSTLFLFYSYTVLIIKFCEHEWFALNRKNIEKNILNLFDESSRIMYFSISKLLFP